MTAGAYYLTDVDSQLASKAMSPLQEPHHTAIREVPPWRSDERCGVKAPFAHHRLCFGKVQETFFVLHGQGILVKMSHLTSFHGSLNKVLIVEFAKVVEEDPGYNDSCK